MSEKIEKLIDELTTTVVLSKRNGVYDKIKQLCKELKELKDGELMCLGAARDNRKGYLIILRVSCDKYCIQLVLNDKLVYNLYVNDYSNFVESTIKNFCLTDIWS